MCVCVSDNVGLSKRYFYLNDVGEVSFTMYHRTIMLNIQIWVLKILSAVLEILIVNYSGWVNKTIASFQNSDGYKTHKSNTKITHVIIYNSEWL